MITSYQRRLVHRRLREEKFQQWWDDTYERLERADRALERWLVNAPGPSVPATVIVASEESARRLHAVMRRAWRDDWWYRREERDAMWRRRLASRFRRLKRSYGNLR